MSKINPVIDQHVVDSVRIIKRYDELTKEEVAFLQIDLSFGFTFNIFESCSIAITGLVDIRGRDYLICESLLSFLLGWLEARISD